MILKQTRSTEHGQRMSNKIKTQSSQSQLPPHPPSFPMKLNFSGTAFPKRLPVLKAPLFGLLYDFKSVNPEINSLASWIYGKNLAWYLALYTMFPQENYLQFCTLCNIYCMHYWPEKSTLVLLLQVLAVDF